MEEKAKRKFITPPGRLCFAAIFEKGRQMEGGTGEPKYEGHLVFDVAYLKKNPAELKRFNDIKRACEELAMEKFKKPLSSFTHQPFRKGEDKEHLEGFGAGTIFIHPKSKRRPGVVLADGITKIVVNPLDRDTVDAAKEIVYSGCYVRFTVHPFSYTNRQKGVSLGLDSVMFVRDGDRLDGGSNAEDDFGEVAEPGVADDSNSDLL